MQLPNFDRVKGIHPGVILKRELTRRSLKAIDLANAIGEYPQTVNAITKEKRGVNPKLSIKLGKYFDIYAEYFMLLQASYEVNKALCQAKINPLEGKVRQSLFWDTELDKLDLVKHKRYITQRILERGSKSEIEELIKLYGKEDISKEILQISNSILPSFEKNVKKFTNPKVHGYQTTYS